VELESIRAKFIDEEHAHKKLQEQYLAEKLKRVNIPNATDEEIKNDSHELIKGRQNVNLFILFYFFLSFFNEKKIDLEKKLDAERTTLKRTNDELMQVQKKSRMLEMDLKQLTCNYNQLIYDHQVFKQSNEQFLEQMESDQQRRNQYDKDFKYLQQQLTNALHQEKQTQNDLSQTRQENQRLQDNLRTINHDHEAIKAKLVDYEEQVEGRHVRFLDYEHEYRSCCYFSTFFDDDFIYS
jgi:Fe-S-cluster formation regulator IscX/YfhJ